MLALQPGSKEVPELERPIREADRRVCVVSLMGENRAGDYVTVSIKIEEGKKRKLDLENPAHIAYVNKARDGYGGGRLMGLLDDQPLH